MVVGGGMAGLAVARGLLHGGWEVEVRERLPGPSDIGGALGMWPGAMAALDELGLGERVRARSEYREVGTLLRPDGSTLLRIGGRGGMHLVSRSVLLDILLTALPEGVVRWNTPVTLNEGTIELGRDADVVVGADGINSSVRRAVFSHARPPRPLGSIAYRGTLPGPVEHATETWGRGGLFGITPMDTGNTNWFAALARERVDAHGDADHATVLHREFGGWHGDVTQVLQNLDPHRIDRRELHDLPAFGPYARGRHVLVGDAAHAMAPNLGRGACEALVDAVALAATLNGEPTLARALARYDRARRGPTRRLVVASRVVNRITTRDGYVPLRDRALNTLLREH